MSKKVRMIECDHCGIIKEYDQAKDWERVYWKELELEWFYCNHCKKIFNNGGLNNE